MTTNWYVLKRDNERMVVGVPEGNDPLYGNGSWDYLSGPHATESAALLVSGASLMGSIRSKRKAASSAANGKIGGRHHRNLDNLAWKIYSELYGHLDDKHHQSIEIPAIHDWLVDGDQEYVQKTSIEKLAAEWKELNTPEDNE
jgi:hypothetical protein